ncbi:MAG: DUF1016 N-terminal domain-containing protein [Burkholderiales bacterium]
MLSRQLSTDRGTSFGEKNLHRTIQFAEVLPKEQIVVSLIRELSWTHFVALLLLKAPLQREFYVEMCRAERWSVRALRDEDLYTALPPKDVLQRKLQEAAAVSRARLANKSAADA